MRRQPGQEVRIRGKVRKIIFENPNTGYAVLELDNGIVVTGPFEGQVQVGLPILVIGEWHHHPQFGPQIQMSYFEVPADRSDPEALATFLAWSLRGIGKQKARLIVQFFGDRTLDVLDEHPEEILAVPGIGPKTLQRVQRSWHIYTATRKLFMKLAGYGLSFRLARRVYQAFGDEALRILEENPYRLTEVPHIGFLKADEIARQMGISEDDPRRIEAGILYVLHESAYQKGHVFLPATDLLQKLGKIKIQDQEKIHQGLETLAEHGKVVIENGRVYAQEFYRAEVFCAEKLIHLLHQPVAPILPSILQDQIQRFEREFGLTLSENQKQVVKDSIQSPVFLLTGYAGTGKTTVTRVIASIFESSGLKVRLCAPTGKAAKRLEEATGYPASTIHRLLKFNGKEWLFNHQNPLPVDVLIVDEMSMVDLLLFYRLLDAIPDRARLIMIGDPAQLPPIGPGLVLQDLLRSPVIPTRILTKIFRQEGKDGIVLNANAIREGKGLVRTRTEDFLYVELENDVTERLQALARRMAAHYGDQFQYLTGMRKGALGVETMNLMIRDVLNPGDGPTLYGFRQGDRVIQVVNNYNKVVFNGEIGTVVHVNPEERTLRVDFGEDRIVEYEAEEIPDNLELAYALTVHKFQGSEAPVILLPLVTEQYLMLHRNWLYTAMTRAEELLVLAGTRKALRIAIRNQRPIQRFTSLSERLERISGR